MIKHSCDHQQAELNKQPNLTGKLLLCKGIRAVSLNQDPPSGFTFLHLLDFLAEITPALTYLHLSHLFYRDESAHFTQTCHVQFTRGIVGLRVWSGEGRQEM